MKKLGTQYTLESWMIANGNSGDAFYSEKKDKDITAIAAQHKRKVKTERFIAVKSAKEGIPEAIRLTRVTIL